MFWHKTVNLGVIDPTNLEQDSIKTRVLRKFLIKKSREHKKFNPKQNYIFNYKGTRYSFQLSHNIIARARSRNENESRFEVVSNDRVQRSNRGGMAVFYHIDGTLAPDLGGRLIYKKIKSRGVKRALEPDQSEAGDLNPEDTFEQVVEREYNLTRHISAIRVKPPTITSENIQIDHRGEPRKGGVAYTVMRRLPGSNLAEILDDKQNPLTVDECLYLCIRLLRILQQQFHDQSIIHCDLKPANIMFDRATGEVHIIDLGLSKMGAEVRVNENIGTLSYISPEQFNNEATDELTDVYSLGKVFSEIWNMPHTTLDLKLMPVQMAFQTLQSDFSQSKETEFHEDSYQKVIEELEDSESSDQIQRVIKSMAAMDRDNRVSVTDALQRFESIRLKRKMKDESIEIGVEPEDIVSAHEAGLRAWDKCRDEAIKPSSNMKSLKGIIVSELKHVPKDELAVGAFIDALDVREFAGCTTKSQIIERIDLLDEGFTENMNALLARMAGLEKILTLFDKDVKSRFYKLINSMYSEIDAVLQKMNDTPISIDGMAMLNMKFISVLDKVDSRLSELDQVYDAPGTGKDFTLSGVVSKLLDSQAEDDKSDIGKLRAVMKQAIAYYLESAYTKKSIHKHDRAASQRRLKDMSEILDLINNPEIDNADTLFTQVKERMNKIKRGIFGSNKFFLRSFGSSELVENLEDAMSAYQRYAKSPSRNRRD